MVDSNNRKNGKQGQKGQAFDRIDIEELRALYPSPRQAEKDDKVNHAVSQKSNMSFSGNANVNTNGAANSDEQKKKPTPFLFVKKNQTQM